jgi:MoaA/NifB/PqqE/SkfB family radical SAM enzyme
VDTDKALRAIDRLADFGVAHMCFTGGEALLHPHAVEIVERASKRNINSAMLLAAPQLLLRNDMVKRLEAAGNDLVSISFDSGDPEIMAQSRQIENIMDDLARALEAVRKTRVKTMASVLIWNGNFDKLKDVCDEAVRMGFDFISLNYPTFSESAVYELGGEGISLSPEQLIRSLESAIELKKKSGCRIINAASSMRNIVNYLKDPASARYHCFGGRHVMFVDWFFDVYPCMQLPDSLGNILTMEEKALNIAPCNKCNMSWYRDLSTFFHGPRSLPMILEAAASSGKLL